MELLRADLCRIMRRSDCQTSRQFLHHICMGVTGKNTGRKCLRGGMKAVGVIRKRKLGSALEADARTLDKEEIRGKVETASGGRVGRARFEIAKVMFCNVSI